MKIAICGKMCSGKTTLANMIKRMDERYTIYSFGLKIKGIAADVFEMEDWVLPDRPEIVPERLLKQMGKTLFTPHIGSAVGRVRLKIAMQAASAIGQCLEGKQPDWAVNQI